MGGVVSEGEAGGRERVIGLREGREEEEEEEMRGGEKKKGDQVVMKGIFVS